MSSTLLRFKDLAANGIVKNWPQLKNLVDRHGFPSGFMLSTNCRVWWRRPKPTLALPRGEGGTDKMWFENYALKCWVAVLGIIVVLLLAREWWNFECDAECEAKRDVYSWRRGQ